MDHGAARNVAPGDHAAHLTVTVPADLAAILRPGVNVCLWRRRIGPAFGAWLDALCAAGTFLVEAVLDGDRPDATPLLAPVPSAPERERLRADVEDLVRRYARLSGAAGVRAELAVQARDSCRKFHVDYVGLRLLCTYAGPGTEWIPNEAVRREILERPDLSIAATNRAIVACPGGVWSAARGEVLLLKGEAWPGNAGNGAVHRSPPIEAAGARRLLLTLDSHQAQGGSVCGRS